MLRDAAIDTLRRRFAPADLVGNGIEYRKVLRMLRHQLAPELERILADRMRQFVHETFEIDRVVIDVHAAPETRRDGGIAHRMLDQKIGNRISNRSVAARIEALECDGVHAVDQSFRAQAEQDGLPRQPEYPPSSYRDRIRSSRHGPDSLYKPKQHRIAHSVN